MSTCTDTRAPSVTERLAELGIVPLDSQRVDDHKRRIERLWHATYLAGCWGLVASAVVLGLCAVLGFAPAWAMVSIALVCLVMGGVIWTMREDLAYLEWMTAFAEEVRLPREVKSLAGQLVATFGDQQVLVEYAQADPLMKVYDHEAGRYCYVAIWLGPLVIYNGATQPRLG